MTPESLKDFSPLPVDLQGWNGDAPTFKNLVHEVRPKIIIEVGTWKGASTVSMAKVCKELGLDTKIFCVDTWLGSLEFAENEKLFGPSWSRMLKFGYPQVYYQFLSNIVQMGVADMIEPVPMLSRDAAVYLPQADLIYLDGSHDYTSVKEDIGAYWPKLNVGGVIFGDDYWLSDGNGNHNNRQDKYKPDVKTAIGDFIAMATNCGVQLQFNIVENNFWVIKKLS